MKTAPIVIGVGGGKRATGKSVAAIGIAASLADRGFRTVLLEAHTGSQSLHQLLGLSYGAPTVSDFLTKKVRTADELGVSTSVPGLSVIATHSPDVQVDERASSADRTQAVLGAIRQLVADYIVIDVGAWSHYDAMEYFLLADHRVLAVAPDLASIHSAYFFLKAALCGALRELTTNEDTRRLLKTMLSGSEIESLRGILRRVDMEDPSVAVVWRRVIESFGLSILGNMIENQVQHHVVRSFANQAHELLCLNHHAIGFAPRDPFLERMSNGKDIGAAIRGELQRELAAFAEQLEKTKVEPWRGTRTRRDPARAQQATQVMLSARPRAVPTSSTPVSP